MADLKLPKSSKSNSKIGAVLTGLFAIIAYMRLLGSDEQQAGAQAADGNLREDGEEVYLASQAPDISNWQAEIEQLIPADKPMDLIKAPVSISAEDLIKAPVSISADSIFRNKNSRFSFETPNVDPPQVSGASIAILAPAELPTFDPAGLNVSGNTPAAPPEIAVQTEPDTIEQDPSVLPEDPSLLPEDPSVLPEDPSVLPEDPSVLPEDCVGTDQIAPITAIDCDPCAEGFYSNDVAQSINRLLVEGTAMSDAISGTDAAEEILGFAGGDWVDGAGGDDVIIGGAGDDDLAGSDGDDALMGGDDDDRLTGGTGSDLVMGESGDDLVDGGAGNDLLLGGIGADAILGGDGDDRLLGGHGDDILHDGNGADVLLGSYGDDTIYLFSDADADFVDGGDGFDRLDLAAANMRSRTDIALGEVQIDNNPADNIVGIEEFVSGAAADEFDFSGFAVANHDSSAPMFFQITDFGRGDTVRVTESFTIGFDDFTDDRLWVGKPEAVSELEARMRNASGDAADAVPSRLAFRSAAEEEMVARVIDFDFDSDGHIDLALLIQGSLPEDLPQFADHV